MNLIIIKKIRTSNFNDERVVQKITDMWKVASTELSNHKGTTYGLYYEYESDYKGDYTLGVAVEGENESSIVIPPGTKYEIFEVNAAEEQGVYNTWNEIWKKEEEGQLKRAYTYDFEKYSPDGRIDVYIAVEENS
ncbi:GyrI-like domain-containing protein [Lysinibacillus odysseyi]|uniref:Transcriptional regulator n=1 Tax=Lysinibacillus odysseyi 34hs-1 = NBRC 100172 TaxID=1220589 RepID=A0A0A3ITL0_9BACI|nr:effector binding domain-containing protein [Lysinibacillus odysseyi]KGR86208.1 transcriptional regulator [Lysinibacillus odysseyi 34hs-1 = NBRC 100172]